MEIFVSFMINWFPMLFLGLFVATLYTLAKGIYRIVERW